MWCGGSLEERVLRKRRGVGVRGVVLQGGEGAWRRVAWLWGAWCWGGIRAAEAGGRECCKSRTKWVRRRRGRAFRLTLLTMEEKV